ncbi:MAG: vWA domain-containing protein [Planctomycetia bacterium]|nr:vWA domain-containing protein [Planctomycetia bacterium]
MSSVPSPPPLPPQVPPKLNVPELPPIISGENVSSDGENSSDLSEENASGSGISSELQNWVNRFKTDMEKFNFRNGWLRIVLVITSIIVLFLLVWIHQKTIGKYAVLKDVLITQNPCNQGQVEISFEVVKPGQVYCRWMNDGTYTDICDDYFQPGKYTRPWSWTYHPGKSIDISLWFRTWLFRRNKTESFPTTRDLDMVILIDTTGSMDESLKELKEKCVDFAKKIAKQNIFPRFALIGFGDRKDGEWFIIHDFTANIQEFQWNVGNLKRFDGGDLPESSLDALMEALNLKFSETGMRKFYLITDAPFHPQTADGKDAQAVGEMLRKNRILLNVFCRPQYQKDYESVYGELGRFLEIENFGKVLREGRVLED